MAFVCRMLLTPHLRIFVEGPRPLKEQVLELRGLMLSYIKHLVVRGSGVQDDELQSITNYLTTVHEVAMRTR